MTEVAAARPGARAVLTGDERALVQQHTLRVLLVCAFFGGASVSAVIAVASLLTRDMLSNDSFGGIGGASMQLGSALASVNLAGYMIRRGRRPGLQLGYVFGFLGSLIALTFGQLELLPLYLIGMVLFGGGQSANLQARYAAADLAETANRGQAIALILFGQTAGSIMGPLLTAPTGNLAHALGLHRIVGPFLFSMACFVLAELTVMAMLRPDPLVAAGGVRPDAPRQRPILTLRLALGAIGRSPRAKVALAALIVSQSVMVMVMTMTPLHLRAHGHSATLSGFVISLHVAGMYGFSPLVGRSSDRVGRPRTLLFGGGVLALATIVTALAGEVVPLMFVGLFLLGVGWSFGLISGSALLTESVAPEERVLVQGSSDLMMSICGGAAGFASGFLKQALGFHMLANIGTIAAVMLVIAVVKVLGVPGTLQPAIAAQ